MTEKFRSDLVMDDFIKGEINLGYLPMVFGMLEFLEQGRSMEEIVKELEAKYPNSEEVLTKVDSASSWIRLRSGELKILI